MSGGSWDYFYLKLEEAAFRLKSDAEPLRRAFGNHLILCSKAMHAVEWVDSSDYGPGDDRKPIEEALGSDAPAIELREVISDAIKHETKLHAAIERAVLAGHKV